MERNNLKDIIDGSMKMPEQEPGRSMWKSKDLDARMEIIMHLSDEQVDYVRNYKQQTRCGSICERFINHLTEQLNFFHTDH